MATITWKKGVSGDWTNKNNWVGGKVPTSADTVDFPADAGHPYTATMDSSETVAALTIGKGATLGIISGNSLVSSGVITVAAGGVLDGVGIVLAFGGFKGGGTIEAGAGGPLSIYGAIPTSMNLKVDGGGDLVVGVTSTIDASKLTISGSSETLTVGAGLTIDGQESLGGANIVLAGGDLTDAKGIDLGGGTLSGHGTVTTGNGAAKDFGGAGTVTASGGTLEFTDAVDKSGADGSTNFAIGDNAALAFDSGVGNLLTPTFPAIDFGSDATLDLTGETNEKSQFHGVVSDFAAGDQILVQSSGAGDFAAFSSNTFEVKDSHGKIVDKILFANGTDMSDLTLSENGGVDTITICFFAGTRIRTPDGEAAVEALKPGDRVITADGRSVAVNWVGKQTISMRFADPERVLPIRVRAGALAENTPARDLLLSRDHALWIDGALVQAGALVNGRSIVQETRVPTVFTYYHVETDDHSLILAECAPAETFVDTVDRLNFDNWAEYQALYPDGKSVEELPYPRAKSHRQVPVRIRVLLAERAHAIGAANEEVA